jgi:hypothetical protein
MSVNDPEADIDAPSRLRVLMRGIGEPLTAAHRRLQGENDKLLHPLLAHSGNP